MAELNKITEEIMLNCGDMTMKSLASLIARVSGGVNLIHQSDGEESKEVQGYTNFQVAVARTIIRCLTLLAKTNLRINADELITEVSKTKGIY